VNSFRVLLVLADIEVRMEIFGQLEVGAPDRIKEKVRPVDSAPVFLAFL
jgi:hypothetical protein